jgi:DNA-directed RNA polymerase specialized sigma24 family protein
MDQTPGSEVTRLLLAWSEGDEAALDALMPHVYAELRRIARRHMARENPHHTLQTSALINEAYLRLVEARGIRWQSRVHFFAVSAQVMRRILVDFARARQNLKRGGGARRITLDEALSRLATLSPRQGRVVELRYFGGLTESEIGEVLKVSLRTVRNDWRLARTWLYRELSLERRHDA